MFTKARLLGVVAILSGIFMASAEEPAELVNELLKSESVASTSNTETKKSILVAARPDSLLRLADENKKSSPLEILNRKKTPSISIADAEKANTEAKKLESGIDRRMQSLDRSLRREEKRLESRLEELGTKRDRALEKGDEETLKRIEKAEKQAVVDYERRINRLLAAMSKSTPSPISQAVGSNKGNTVSRPSRSRSSISSMLKPSTPTWNSSKAAEAARQPKAGPTPPKTPPTQTPAKRKFKLWPFR